MDHLPGHWKQALPLLCEMPLPYLLAPLTLFCPVLMLIPPTAPLPLHLPPCPPCCSIYRCRLGPRRRHKSQDMDHLPGPWKQALPLLGNVLSLLRLDVHRQLLAWADEHGGVFR